MKLPRLFLCQNVGETYTIYPAGSGANTYKALAVSIGLWDKCWKHKDFVFICYPVQVSSHILAPRGGNLTHREFIYIGKPLPKLDEKEHAAFFLNLQKGILLSLKQRNLLTPAQYQECLAELGKRESKNQICNTIKQKHSLWKKISPIFTRIFNCQQHSLMWSRKLTTSGGGIGEAIRNKL